MTISRLNLRKGLARHSVRALFIGAGLTALAACDLWIGDPAATLPDAGSWVVLPMRAFLSRPGIDMVGMQLCTVSKCGYDAAIERFIATGDVAAELEKQLSQPRQLAGLIGKREPNSRIPPPKVAVEDFGSGKWSGVHVAMSGGTRSHQVEGYVVSQKNTAGTTFVVVIAAKGDVAKRLITEATQ